VLLRCSLVLLPKQGSLSLSKVQLVALAACNINKPSYVVYTATQDSPMQISFEYPREWKWEILGLESDTSMTIGTFLDPLNYQKGNIFISVFVEKLSAVEYYQRTNDRLTGFIINPDLYDIKVDEHILINGLSARKLIILGNARPRQNDLEDFYKELIYLHGNDTNYEIVFEIPVDDRDSDFGQAFNHLIETIKIR
jgi:hypothetical protein